MKKNKSKLYLKISILMSLLVAFFAFAIPKTYAYTLDEQGNIQSENLFNINDYYSINQNITIDNDTLHFNEGGAVVVQLWQNLNSFVSEPIAFTSNGSISGTFTKLANTNYLRIKSNLTNRDIWYDISNYETNSVYSLSVVVSGYNNSSTLSNVMLNKGSISLDYEPYGTWYKEGALPSQLYNAFNGASVYLYNIMNTNRYVAMQQITNLTAQSSSITSENLTGIYDYLLNLDYDNLSMNQLKFYIQIDLNTAIDSSLLFNFNETTYQKTITLVNTTNNQTWSYDSHSSETLGNYQIVVNNEFNTFDRIIYNYIYMPDYSYFDISLSYDGFSYSQGFQNGVNSISDELNFYKKEYERQKGIINSQTQTIENLNNELENSGLGWKPLFFAMADTPFKVVKNALGFEVFGVDLFGAFVGFLTLLAILWVIKKIMK